MPENFTQFDDLVVRHAEQRMFNSPRTGLPTSKYGNAYYHPKQHCLKVKWEDFQPHDLVIRDNMLPLLSTVHKEMAFHFKHFSTSRHSSSSTINVYQALLITLYIL